MTNEWNKLKDGEERVFGFLQVDTAKSGQLNGPDVSRQKTKANLRKVITGVLELCGARKLIWAGDGGTFLFLISNPKEDYDNMVAVALYVLETLPFFNLMKGLFNWTDQDLRLRISCHEGRINFSKNPEEIHGSQLDYFLKYERAIAQENAVTITEDVYKQLMSSNIKDLFRPKKPHEFMLAGKLHSKALYFSKGRKTEPPIDKPLLRNASIIQEKAEAMGTACETILSFTTERIARLYQILEASITESGTELGRAEIGFITQLCFRFGGKYDGTDSHVPSRYLEAYPDYLTFHSENLERNPGKENRGERILITTRAALREDINQHSEEYEDFFNWHTENGITLLEVDPITAYDLKTKFKIPATDLGIWQKYALFFSPQGEKGKARLWLAHDGDEVYTRSVEYFKALANKAKPITLFPELFDRALAINWEEFVSPNDRLKLEGPFLIKLLKPYNNGRILDAAAGIGCESIYLTQQGFTVFPNEIERELREIARSRAKENRVLQTMLQYDWRFLGDEIAEPYFYAVLVLGNSLCLVLDRADRKRCLEQFGKVLKPGGMLVVDERNFPYIIENRKQILQNPVKNFRYSHQSMYCEKSVRGVPYHIDEDEDKITFMYFKNGRQVANLDEARENRVGYLEMYPFKKGELAHLLEECGFTDVHEYSDFKEGHSDEADFFTYTAIWP